MLNPLLRDAAFGASPALAVPRSGAPLELLLAAIVLGARGWYAAAATLLAPLSRERDPVTASLALSTLASHRRQLGGHDVARGLDGAALALAMRARDGPPDPDGLDACGARSDALLGLAADNLAVGRLAAARRLADAAAEVSSGWRARVRAGWVGAELALASGSAQEAVEPAEGAVEEAVKRGARRHVVKSRLVLGATLSAAWPEDAGATKQLVEEALADAEECELNSLIWPACLIAAGMAGPDREKYRFRSKQVLHGVLLRADPVGRRIASESPWVPV